jgi:hypothetical protein
LSSTGHRLRDQKPGMPKTRDFGVKGGNNFSSIHYPRILNHIDYQMLSGMENMARGKHKDKCRSDRSPLEISNKGCTGEVGLHIALGA